ncbi:hypothetical protein L208DRAFT_654183 [Tricholoma matsutake]|nr:hypothetical protein L208DRAFT_654183 [Tricholoma matsutake 945]
MPPSSWHSPLQHLHIMAITTNCSISFSLQTLLTNSFPSTIVLFSLAMTASIVFIGGESDNGTSLMLAELLGM